jgi:hypothetical protein
MIIRHAPVIPEIARLLHSPSSYINKNGENPTVDSMIDPETILNGEWAICVNDESLFEKMNQQIVTMKMYGKSVLILG